MVESSSRLTDSSRSDPWQGLKLEDLTPGHVELLKGRGIAPAVATARGVFTARKKIELERLGFNRKQCLTPALVIPVFGPTGQLVTHYMRPDSPRVIDGKVCKYELPPKSPIGIDVPPGARAGLRDPSVPLFVTEGPLKADSGVSHGLCSVALLGVWMFKQAETLCDWDEIVLPDRHVYIAFDSDAMSKPGVHEACRRLGEILKRRKANVQYIYLPAADDGAKIGLDDFLAAGHTAAELLALARPELAPLPADAKASVRLAELRRAAKPVLDAGDPLPKVKAAIKAFGYGGDVNPAMLIYLAVSSRLLAARDGAMPAHVALIGPPSTGKSFTAGCVLRLLPPEAYHRIDAGSPKVLIHDPASLKHRVVVFGESDSLPAGEDNPAASAVRNLLQDGRLHYSVVEQHRETGEFVVREIDKPGPSVLLTTAVRSLGSQLDSRLFRVEVPDTFDQVRAALTAQARVELHGASEPPEDLVAYQAVLQMAAPWDVAVPFAEILACEIKRSPIAARVLRDFARLLSLIKTVTVLRHPRRQTEGGRLVAALDDYVCVHEFVADVYISSASGAGTAVRETVEAVAHLLHDDPSRQATAVLVAEKLGIHKSNAGSRIRRALAGGWLINSAERGRPYRLTIGEPLPPDAGLPSPARLIELVESSPAAALPVNDATAQPDPVIPTLEPSPAVAVSVAASNVAATAATGSATAPDPENISEVASGCAVAALTGRHSGRLALPALPSICLTCGRATRYTDGCTTCSAGAVEATI
jgi:Domain of unknown function (DUF3854)